MMADALLLIAKIALEGVKAFMADDPDLETKDTEADIDRLTDQLDEYKRNRAILDKP